MTQPARLLVLFAMVVVCACTGPAASPTPAGSDPGATSTPISELASPTAGATLSRSPSPSPTPSLEPPDLPFETLDAQRFEDALRAGELFDRVVVVDGQVEESHLATACSPGLYDGQRCPLGQLEGTQPPIQIDTQAQPTTEARASTLTPQDDSWEWWSFPETPISGSLILSVGSGGQVEYLGRHRPNGSSVTWSVSQALAVDPGSLDEDEILLVDGWLDGTSAMVDCAMVRGITSLPNRSCSYVDWLTDTPATEPEMHPPVGSIELEQQTYFTYAPLPAPEGEGAGVAREGIYAIRPRLEGWCETENGPASGPPPCWRWVMVGRLAPAATELHVPPRDIRCDHLSLGLGGSTSGSDINVVDEAGLITDCLASWGSPPDGEPKVVVENPLPNNITLNIAWPGRSCDSGVLTVTAEGDRYAVAGNIEAGACEDDFVVSHQVALGLSESIAASQFDVTISGLHGVAPSPSPAPPPSVIPCTTTDRHATLVDETGYIDACQTVEPTQTVDGIQVFEFVEDGLGGIRVLWMGSACDDAPVFHVQNVGMRTELRGELAGEPCGAEDVTYEIRMINNTDMSPAAMDATLTRVPGPIPQPSAPSPSASATFDTKAGRFVISARASKQTYRTGEPIDITGSIVLQNEPGFTLDVFGGHSREVPGLIHFGWEKVDTGDLRIGPSIRHSCKSTELKVGVPVEGAIAKEGGNFGDREHDAFWESYFAEPAFTLPPGRYRVMARAQFKVGSCESDDLVGLYVPIFINVTEP